jgi:hypothetical protein
MFGIAPALQTANIDANEALKTGGRSGTTTKASGRLRAFLVTSEIAMAVLLILAQDYCLRASSGYKKCRLDFNQVACSHFEWFYLPP